MKHFLNLIDCTAAEITGLLDSAARLKTARQKGVPSQVLAGKVVALIFEKPSLRTRVSFEAGVAQLGGTSLYLAGSDVGLGWRETLADFSRTMSRYVDAMIFRVFSHKTLLGIQAASSVPVINGLSDESHPCQGLADLLTIREHCGDIAGKKFVFVGDGNNVARSLAVGCGRLGAEFVLACPVGYGFEPIFVANYMKNVNPTRPVEINDPMAAVKGADIIYTDVWTSMGQEAEREERLRRFAGFQVNAKLVAAAGKQCKVLHCLPAHRGEEITDEVVDGPQSVVFDEAENRLHAQKAVLELLFQ
ncbi:ornithine carbamoyltransferase [soil metagenome]